MSRSPKYSQARLEAERHRELVRERRRLAAVEAQQRRQREEEERRRRAQEAAQRAARLKAEKDARDAVIELQAQLFGVRTDSVTMAWCSSEVGDTAIKIEELERLMKSEQWNAVTSRSGEIRNDIDLLLKKAQERQLKEEIRSYIQKNMGAALARMGFQVGAPYLVEPGDYDSDVVIRARRPDGKAAQIQVATDGNVSYTVDGYPMRRVDVGGKQFASCDEAQTMIESFHQLIRKQFGIDMSELQWEDKLPIRLSRDHKEVPDDGANAYQKPGGWI